MILGVIKRYRVIEAYMHVKSMGFQRADMTETTTTTMKKVKVTLEFLSQTVIN